MFIYPIEENLALKLITENDATEIFNLIDRNRTYLREWLGWIDNSTEVAHILPFIRLQLEKFASREALDTAIVYEGKIVGKISINSINRANGIAYFGYMLDEAYSGKGIMTKAVQAMMEISFEHFGARKVEIHAAEDNYKSRAIPERLGYRQEGIIRQNEWLYDHYVDHVVYGIFKEN